MLGDGTPIQFGEKIYELAGQLSKDSVDDQKQDITTHLSEIINGMKCFTDQLGIRQAPPLRRPGTIFPGTRTISTALANIEIPDGQSRYPKKIDVAQFTAAVVPGTPMEGVHWECF
ncbi:hypothetical protein B0H14DRAFT_2567819 [Mycena olivaceomarginata]|nr:hypothetical protein B0H14DRAFT_2567819 [Mycena olivaceomarginata]